jgi:hypothetical protein
MDGLDWCNWQRSLDDVAAFARTARNNRENTLMVALTARFSGWYTLQQYCVTAINLFKPECSVAIDLLVHTVFRYVITVKDSFVDADYNLLAGTFSRLESYRRCKQCPT